MTSEGNVYGVIRRKGNKWLGYPDEFNPWVDNKDLVKLLRNSK